MIQPCEGLSTGEVFRAYHACETVERPDTEHAARALATGDTALLAASLRNVMQPVSRQMRPEIGEAIDALMACGAACALMTGSGSAVFGVFEEEAQAQAARDALHTRWARCSVCITCSESIVIEE